MVDSATLAQALRDAADATRPLGLDAWAVLLEWSDKTEWAQAWDQLTAVERERLLNRLHDDQEPLARGLLQVLADNAAHMVAAQARQQLYFDAAESMAAIRDRLGERAQRLRDLGDAKSAEAIAEVDRVAALQEEVNRLEAELQSDPLLEKRETLEGELVRLQLRALGAKSYDVAAREAEFNRLTEEVSALEAEKTRIEEAISRALHEREVTLRRLEDRRREHQQLATTTGQANGQIQQMDAELGGMRQHWEVLRAEGQKRLEQRKQLETALDEVRRDKAWAEDRVAEAEMALSEAWRQSLDHFQQMAQRHGALLLSDRQRLSGVQEVFQSAMRAFNSRRGPIPPMSRGR